MMLPPIVVLLVAAFAAEALLRCVFSVLKATIFLAVALFVFECESVVYDSGRVFFWLLNLAFPSTIAQTTEASTKASLFLMAVVLFVPIFFHWMAFVAETIKTKRKIKGAAFVWRLACLVVIGTTTTMAEYASICWTGVRWCRRLGLLFWKTLFLVITLLKRYVWLFRDKMTTKTTPDNSPGTQLNLSVVSDKVRNQRAVERLRTSMEMWAAASNDVDNSRVARTRASVMKDLFTSLGLECQKAQPDMHLLWLITRVVATLLQDLNGIRPIESLREFPLFRVSWMQTLFSLIERCYDENENPGVYAIIMANCFDIFGHLFVNDMWTPVNILWNSYFIDIFLAAGGANKYKLLDDGQDSHRTFWRRLPSLFPALKPNRTPSLDFMSRWVGNWVLQIRECKIATRTCSIPPNVLHLTEFPHPTDEDEEEEDNFDPPVG